MKKLLLIGLRFPEYTTGAGKRIMQLITYFIEQGYTIRFVSAANKTPHSVSLQDLGIEEHIIPVNDSTFDLLIKQWQPDICLFDRFIAEEQFSWRVKENAPNCKLLLDTEDLHFLRSAREKSLKNGLTVEENYWNDPLTIREISSIWRCDLSLIISEYEFKLLTLSFDIPSHVLMYVPMYYEESNLEINSYENRCHFVFVGNFMHNPNVDAVLHLKKNIWKQIKQQIPDAELHIYGAYVPKQIADLHNKKEGFIIKGYTEKLEETLKGYKLMLAPLRFGAGLKTKIIDARQVRLPFVLSQTAAEGILDAKSYGFIAQNDQEFIQKAVELYSSKKQYGKAQKQMELGIGKFFTKDFFNAQMELVLRFIKEENKFIIHKILWQNQFLTTKYMGKWIEEKNKPK